MLIRYLINLPAACTDRERLVGIAMAAYQIENLHLAPGVITKVPDEKSSQALEPIYQLVLSQKSIVEIHIAFGSLSLMLPILTKIQTIPTAEKLLMN